MSFSVSMNMKQEVAEKKEVPVQRANVGIFYGGGRYDIEP